MAERKKETKNEEQKKIFPCVHKSFSAAGSIREERFCFEQKSIFH